MIRDHRPLAVSDHDEGTAAGSQAIAETRQHELATFLDEKILIHVEQNKLVMPRVIQHAATGGAEERGPAIPRVPRRGLFFVVLDLLGQAAEGVELGLGQFAAGYLVNQLAEWLVRLQCRQAARATGSRLRLADRRRVSRLAGGGPGIGIR